MTLDFWIGFFAAPFVIGALLLVMLHVSKVRVTVEITIEDDDSDGKANNA